MKDSGPDQFGKTGHKGTVENLRGARRCSNQSPRALNNQSMSAAFPSRGIKPGPIKYYKA
jgi:hypothetical protein